MPNEQKKSTGRKCSICTHKECETINSQLATGVSFRDISQHRTFSYSSVYRHAENCLGLTIGAVIQEKKIKQAIDVYEEFREQLSFAKQLRTAAQSYLSDANDPLRLSITPKAHEIEVTYFDHNDKVMIGDELQPKKKSAQLNVLLEAIYTDAQLEPDKYKITTVDIRKFALDAINTADTCIDKFAKMGGSYQQDKKNEHDIKTVIAEFISKARGTTPDAEILDIIQETWPEANIKEIGQVM